jgi:hypothetical protein
MIFSVVAKEYSTATYRNTFSPLPNVCASRVASSMHRDRFMRRYPLHPFQSSFVKLSLSSSSSGNDFNNDGNKSEESKAKVRFTGVSVSELDELSTNNNLLDTLLALLISDAGSIALGVIGLVALLVIRLSSLGDSSDSLGLSAEAQAQQTRDSLLAVLAIGSVLLNGIAKLDVEAAMAETVVLEGTSLSALQLIGPSSAPLLSEKARSSIQWAFPALLAAAPTQSITLMHYSHPASSEKDIPVESPMSQWQLVAQAGIVPLSSSSTVPATTITLSMKLLTKTPILDRFRPFNAEDAANSARGIVNESTYLPTLQNLPGRIEFTTTYMPPNTQAVLVVPFPMSANSESKTILDEATMTSRFVLVLGSNQARSFTPKDIAWCEAIAARLSDDFSS